MIMNGMRPVHPGECLREDYLLPIDMKSSELAEALDVSPTYIDNLLGEQSSITPDMALRLARYFDTTPRFWLALQTEYDLRSTELAHSERIFHTVLPRQAVQLSGGAGIRDVGVGVGRLPG